MNKETKQRKPYIGAYISEELMKRFQAHIKNNGGNISWFVGKAIEEKLDRANPISLKDLAKKL
ncbi:MAG: hypothetical protein WC756_21575 [Taibaiella sp.]|jgi:hypothetical protein